MKTLWPEDIRDIESEVLPWLDEVVPDQYVLALHLEDDGTITADCVPKAGIETAPLTPDGNSLLTTPCKLEGPPPSLLALA